MARLSVDKQDERINILHAAMHEIDELRQCVRNHFRQVYIETQGKGSLEREKEIKEGYSQSVQGILDDLKNNAKLGKHRNAFSAIGAKIGMKLFEISGNQRFLLETATQKHVSEIAETAKGISSTHPI